MEWAARQNLKGLAQLVLLRLCFHHNHETKRCDPSIGTLAEGAGISGDKVRRCIREIEKSDLLEKEIRKVGKVNASNAYRVRLDRGVQDPQVPANSQGVPANSQGGTGCDTRGVLANSQPNKELNKELNKEESGPPFLPEKTKGKVLKMQSPPKALPVPDLPSWIDSEAFAEWLTMRSDDLKKPASASVIKAAIKKLGRYRDAGEDPNKVLEHVTLNQWQGLYPGKNGETRADLPAKPEVVYEEISFGEAYAGHLPTGSEGR